MVELNRIDAHNALNVNILRELYPLYQVTPTLHDIRTASHFLIVFVLPSLLLRHTVGVAVDFNQST